MADPSIEIDYPFEPADAFLCVPACINTLLRRRGLQGLPQAEIAKELGLIVPPTLAEVYPWAPTSDLEADWGVHPQRAETSLTAFFRKHDIPLRELFYRPQEIFGRDYEEFIAANLAHDNDMLVGYDFRTAIGEGSHVGHVSIISGVNSRRTVVRLIDPERPTAVSVGVPDLLRGVTAQKDGFWVIGSDMGIEWCRTNY